VGSGLLQPGHLVVILIVVLIFVGPGKLPEVGSALGTGFREFKRSANEAGRGSQGASQMAFAPTSVGAADATRCGRCQSPAALGARYCGACGHDLSALV